MENIESNESNVTGSSEKDTATLIELFMVTVLVAVAVRFAIAKLLPKLIGCRKLKMNTDGSVIQDEAGSGGVGQAGFDLVIRDEGGNLIAGFYGRLKDCSIFEAELRGIHRGLETLQDHNLSKVEIESDSQAAVNQINSVKATSAKLSFVMKSMIEECKEMLQRRGCTLKQIPREGNRVANRLAKLGRDQEADFVSVIARPDKEVTRLLAEDIKSAKRIW